MNEKMTQNGRLDFLVEEFKTDSVQYKDLQTPKDTEGKRRNHVMINQLFLYYHSFVVCAPCRLRAYSLPIP